MRKQKAVFAIVLSLIFTIVSPLFGNEVANPSMEGSFISQGSLGSVAENWKAWQGDTDNGFFPSPNFSQSPYGYFHTGTKSQAIEWEGYGPQTFADGGIYQQLTGLQTGKTYNASAWFDFAFIGGDVSQATWIYLERTSSIGLDLNGGTDPAAVSNWAGIYHNTYTLYDYTYDSGWFNLNTNFIATDSTATLFIKIQGFGDAAGPDSFWPEETVMYPWLASCYVDDVDVQIVPEPATIILFGLGALMLRKRS